jgi:2-iminobutanoate/2-iminopropanoate deaminase
MSNIDIYTPCFLLKVRRFLYLKYTKQVLTSSAMGSHVKFASLIQSSPQSSPHACGYGRQARGKQNVSEVSGVYICQCYSKNMKKAFLSSETTGAPLSGAQEANGLIFVSGQIHMNDGKLEGETIEERLEITIRNVEKVLAEAGLTLEDVVKIEVFLTDISELPALNKAYPKYWEHPFPARTALCVKSLPLGATLEIAAIASR